VYDREGLVLPGTATLRVRRDGAAESVDMQLPLQVEAGRPPHLFAELPVAGLGVGRFALSVEFADPRRNAGPASRQVAFEIVGQSWPVAEEQSGLEVQIPPYKAKAAWFSKRLSWLPRLATDDTCHCGRAVPDGDARLAPKPRSRDWTVGDVRAKGWQ